jgi:hypothetical protein
MSDISIPDPDLDDVLELKAQEIFSRLNCVQIGKIEKVNSNQTVSIQIQVKRKNLDKVVDYPLLVDCPYFVLQGGGAYLDIPITIGDYCLILFNDRDIDNWFKNGAIAETRTKRKHSLSDGFALVGINPSSSTLVADGTNVRLIGKSGPGPEEYAARLNDQTEINSVTDSTFITWIANVSAAINILAPGSIPVIPTTATGKISTASSEVKIG